MRRATILLILAIFSIATLTPPAQGQEATAVTPVSKYTVLYQKDGGYTITPITIDCQGQAPSSYSIKLKLYVIGDDNKLDTKEVELHAVITAEGDLCTVVVLEPFNSENTAIAGGTTVITLAYGEGEEQTQVQVEIPVILAEIPDLAPIAAKASEINKTLENVTKRLDDIGRSVENVSSLLEDKIKPAASDISELLDEDRLKAHNITRTLNQLSKRLGELDESLNTIISKAEKINSTLSNSSIGALGLSGGGILTLGQLILTIAVLAVVGLVYVRIRGSAEVLE